MTEIEQVEDRILDEIRANVAGVVSCDTWQGDIEDLLLQTVRKPAVWVIFGTLPFGDKEVIGARNNIVDRPMHFVIAVATESLRSRKDGARGAYELLEAIEARLRGKALAPLRGYLWPVNIELLLSRKSTFIYGLEVKRQGGSS